MLQNSPQLQAIYIEGETKTGKGAASQAVADALTAKGIQVYYDVAGDFFRRYAAIVRRQLKLSADDPLPRREELIAIATELYENGKAFIVDSTLGDLQRPEISNCVSQLGELAIVQAAAVDWYSQSVKQAIQSGATVMVLDGRNPRRHVEQHTSGLQAQTILDIYMICDPEVAARRVLLGDNITDPTPAQLAPIVDTIVDRRQRDQQRTEWPFWWPDTHLPFIPGKDSPEEAIASSWIPQAELDLPVSIVIDNSYVPKPTMWAAVADLAIGALAAAKTTS